MTDVGWALVAAGGLSVIICAIELPWRSKADPVHCLTIAAGLYLAILLVGNISTTLLAGAILKEHPLPGWSWFWQAFLGVFGFEVLLQNLNLTLFKQGVLSLQEWVSAARDQAVEAALRRQTLHGHQQAQLTATRLQRLDDNVLNAHVLQHLGAETLTQLNQQATSNGADARLLKALALAHAKPDEARAIAP